MQKLFKIRIAFVILLLYCGILVGNHGVCSGSGEAVQIVRLDQHSFHVHSDIVEEILGNYRLKDHHLMVFSIAGALRKGKSFFLNFPLKYLQAQYVRHDVSNWIGDNELYGFKYRGGRKPETVGIWMWSEVFTYESRNGDKVAIIILDTQGIFDHESSMKDCTTIFAISMMLSSVQCYNVMQNIQEDNLQHLDFFTQYGQLAMEQTNEKPFQNLLFLVRDWPYAKETDFGYAPKYIEEILAGRDKQTTDMHQLRNRIKSSFQEVNAFLMPYPGEAVAEGKNNEGDLSQIHPTFIKYVEKIVPSIFAPEKLIVKRINGQKIRAGDFVTYLESYVKIFNGNELPEPKTALMATAEASIAVLYKDCFKIYLEMMRESMDRYVKPSELLERHEKAKEKSLSHFQNKRKIGGHELISTYRSLLEKDIAKEFESFERENMNKHKMNEENDFLRKENERYNSLAKEIWKSQDSGFSVTDWIDAASRAAAAAAACSYGGPWTMVVCGLFGGGSKKITG